jgi:hypothetical protein
VDGNQCSCWSAQLYLLIEFPSSLDGIPSLPIQPGILSQPRSSLISTHLPTLKRIWATSRKIARKHRPGRNRQITPPCPPPAVPRCCSDTSSVVHNRPTPRRRACWTSGSWPSPTGPPPRRAPTGSPGSRAWSFHVCQGSLTAQSPQSARDVASCGVAFRHVSRRRHSDRDYFAAQYPACMCPCQRFDGSLTAGHA